MNNGISASMVIDQQDTLLSLWPGRQRAQLRQASLNLDIVQKDGWLNYYGQKCIGTIAVVCSTSAVAAERNVLAPFPHCAGSPLRRGCAPPRSMWKYWWYHGKETEMTYGKITGDEKNVEWSCDLITIVQYKSHTLTVSL
jgi:hypothetical protein